MATILITGGTGLVGKYLQEILKQKQHTVNVLTRSKTKKPNTFFWDVENGIIDDEAIKTADFIIHLAGANISDKRWTAAQRKLIIDSRVNTTNLLLQKVIELKPNLKGFIAASGVGFYGAVTNNHIYTENDTFGTDFLSKVCQVWEQESLKFEGEGIRTVIFRTGVVLTKTEGALAKIIQPIKLGVGAPIGSGKQYMPWIHINDLCNLFTQAIENENFNGIYNAVAPQHITNKELTTTIAAYLKKPLWLPNIPVFVLKLLFGKMAVILLYGSRISSKKIENLGFKFKFPTIEKALKNLI
jgi:uncharacterized protein (TIGR01777 family)